MLSRRATRSSIGGWVLNSFATRPPRSGLTMNMWAVAGLAFMGMRLDAASSLRSAEASHIGFPHKRAPVASAWYSRGTRDRHLDQHRGDRGDDHHRDQPHDAAPVVVVASTAAENHSPLGHVRQQADRTRNRGRYGTDQDVAVAHVREFVGHDPGQLFTAEKTQDPCRRGDGRVVRISSCGERVRGVVGNDINLRHGHVRPHRQVSNDVIELGGLLLGGFLRAVHLQDDLVAEPVRKRVHRQREHECEYHASLSAECPAREHEQDCESDHQSSGLCGVHFTPLDSRPVSGWRDTYKSL